MNQIVAKDESTVIEVKAKKLKHVKPTKTERVNQLLEIDAIMWDRESHGLFDYDNKELKDHRLIALGSSLLVREQNKWFVRSVMPMEEGNLPDNSNKLVSFVYKDNSYWVYHAKTLYKSNGEVDEKFSHFDQAWQIVRLSNFRPKKKICSGDDLQYKYKEKGIKDSVRIEEGDTIKFGRVRFRIKKLVINA